MGSHKQHDCTCFQTMTHCNPIMQILLSHVSEMESVWTNTMAFQLWGQQCIHLLLDSLFPTFSLMKILLHEYSYTGLVCVWAFLRYAVGNTRPNKTTVPLPNTVTLLMGGLISRSRAHSVLLLPDSLTSVNITMWHYQSFVSIHISLISNEIGHIFIGA